MPSASELSAKKKGKKKNRNQTASSAERNQSRNASINSPEQNQSSESDNQQQGRLYAKKESHPSNSQSSDDMETDSQPTYESASGSKGADINNNLQKFRELESLLNSKDSLSPVRSFRIKEEQGALLETLIKDLDKNIQDKKKDKKKAKDAGNQQEMDKSQEKLNDLKLVLKDINLQANELIKDFLKDPEKLAQSEKAQKFINSYMESMYLTKNVQGLLDMETIELLTKLEGVNLKSGTVKEAVDYINVQKNTFSKWLQISPQQRLLISSIVRQAVDNPSDILDELKIEKTSDKLKETPAYQMALSLANSLTEIRQYTREQWDKTLKSYLDAEAVKNLKDRGYSDEKIKNMKNQHKFTQELSRKLFLLMHLGLKERTANDDYIPWTENMATALSHGGRVNIRIPALKNATDNPFELTDWLGITVDGKMNSSPDNGNGVFKRDFATHYIKIDNAKGIFKEEGGLPASGKGKLNPNVQLFGLNLSAGGFGKQDYNDNAIVPDGSHGHMFIGFRKPTVNNDGALQIGVETTAPDKESNKNSMVGYKHNWRSSEKTANPLSSFGGAKVDKHGVGSLDWNRVTLSELNDFNRTWLERLKKEDEFFQSQLLKNENVNIGTVLGKRDELENELKSDEIDDEDYEVDEIGYEADDEAED